MIGRSRERRIHIEARADGSSALALAIGLVVSALVGCDGAASSRRDSVEPSAREAPPAATSGAVHELEPPPRAPAPAPRPGDGVEIPEGLVEQLGEPPLADVERSADLADPIARCTRGCALIDAEGRLVAVRPAFSAESGIPSSVAIVRLEGRALSRREVDVGEVDPRALQRFFDGEGEAPWTPIVRRALGGARLRPAASLVARRATALFSIEEYAPLVALGAPFGDRWIFVEVGRAAYRVHLLRADRGVDRLLATLPLAATACDGESVERTCVAPIGIDDVLAAPDGRTLLVLAHEAAAGHGVGANVEFVLPLEDASLLASVDDDASWRRAIDASLAAPGPRASLFGSEAVEGDSVAARCVRGCALYRGDGALWAVRPLRVVRGDALDLAIFEPRVDPAASAELVPGTEGGDVESRARALASALSRAPTRLGRSLVARAAIANDEGVAFAPSVVLRAPLAGERLDVGLEGDAYVLRWQDEGRSLPLAHAPAIHRGDRVAEPGIVEVFAQPSAGFPLLVVGAAMTRGASAEGGVAHRTFHFVVSERPARPL